jgi:hypothetical protein
MRGTRGFGSVLGRGIINGCLDVAGAASVVVGVDSGGIPYWQPHVCRIISSPLVRRIL